ncbi:hypothetical protein PCE1_001657 [Barthelona sp. PCE]
MDDNTTAKKASAIRSVPLEQEDIELFTYRPEMEEPRAVLMAGYLYKRGTRRKNWRKRWFEITFHELRYSKSPNDAKNNVFLNVLNLERAVYERLNTFDGKNNAFVVRTPGRDLYMSGVTLDDLFGWEAAVQYVLQKNPLLLRDIDSFEFGFMHAFYKCVCGVRTDNVVPAVLNNMHFYDSDDDDDAETHRITKKEVQTLNPLHRLRRRKK